MRFVLLDRDFIFDRGELCFQLIHSVFCRGIENSLFDGFHNVGKRAFDFVAFIIQNGKERFIIHPLCMDFQNLVGNRGGAFGSSEYLHCRVDDCLL